MQLDLIEGKTLCLEQIFVINSIMQRIAGEGHLREHYQVCLRSECIYSSENFLLVVGYCTELGVDLCDTYFHGRIYKL